MTSAPNHARICVHVGPDCTCVISRTRMPSRAFPMLTLLLLPNYLLPICWTRRLTPHIIHAKIGQTNSISGVSIGESQKDSCLRRGDGSACGPGVSGPVETRR